jgi:4-hydroxybenzoyl-CoA thioesterase
MPHPSFQTQRTVRFSDCDPAGIVFFPQYLVMLNAQVEQFFDDALKVSYAGFIGTRRLGLPTVRLEVDFSAISRHGDVLTLTLLVKKLGQSSLAVQHRVHGADGELRLAARQVLVCTSLESHESQPLPDDVRDALEPFLADADTD